MLKWASKVLISLSTILIIFGLILLFTSVLTLPEQRDPCVYLGGAALVMVGMANYLCLSTLWGMVEAFVEKNVLEWSSKKDVKKADTIYLTKDGVELDDNVPYIVRVELHFDAGGRPVIKGFYWV